MNLADMCRVEPTFEADHKDIVLPWPAKELNPNSRVHWSVKSRYAKKARADAFFATQAAGWKKGEVKGKADLWIYFYPPNKRKRDDDNLLSAFKPFRDGIADALGVDDQNFRSHPVVLEETGGRVVVRIAL